MSVITAFHLSNGKKLSVQAGGGERGRDQCPALKFVLHFAPVTESRMSIVPWISGNLSLFSHGAGSIPRSWLGPGVPKSQNPRMGWEGP